MGRERSVHNPAPTTSGCVCGLQGRGRPHPITRERFSKPRPACLQQPPQHPPRSMWILWYPSRKNGQPRTQMPAGPPPQPPRRACSPRRPHPPAPKGQKGQRRSPHIPLHRKPPLQTIISERPPAAFQKGARQSQHPWDRHPGARLAGTSRARKKREGRKPKCRQTDCPARVS